MFNKIDKHELTSNVDFVITGVPFEATSTSPRTGAKTAPTVIRKAFDLFALLTEQGTDIFKKIIVDIGDIEVYPSLIETTMTSITDTISSVLSLKPDSPPIPIIIGGDHFITYPIIQGFIKSLNQKFGIIVFDAHVDSYDKWLYKEEYAHCTVFHRILDIKSLNSNDLLFIGTRDIDYEEAEFLKTNSIKPAFAHSFTQENYESVLSEQLQLFKDRQIEKVYVSIDIDVLDPSCAPGTGYPIPGGLTYRQLWNCLQIVSQNFKVIGFDIVEVSPPYDTSEITAITAARLIMEFIGFITKNMK